MSLRMDLRLHLPRFLESLTSLQRDLKLTNKSLEVDERYRYPDRVEKGGLCMDETESMTSSKK